ncbi:hypothetical protein GCM10027418_05750 [Mariniluteicoccus endophyticus]
MTDPGLIQPTDEETVRSDFATTLNQAVRDKRLTLERIRARLASAGTPVSIATLSYWQTGRSLPTRSSSLRVVTELERVLDLNEGTLTSLASEERRRRSRHLADWEKVIPSADVAAGIITEMGMELPPGDLTRLTVHDTLTVDHDRTEATQLTRMVLRAERSGALRWPVVLEQDAETGVVADVNAVSSCTVGETVAIPERNLTVAEMILPRPLERGELAMVEFLVTFGRTNRQSFRIERSCVNPAREIALEARFPRDAEPRETVAFKRPQMEDGEDIDLREVTLDGHGAQFIVHDPDPGVYGLRWEWA